MFFKNKKRLIIVFFVVFFLLFFLNNLPFMLHGFAGYLRYEKPMKTADLIVVLGGASGSRVKKAVELYHEGVSDLILFTGSSFYLTSDAELMHAYALSLGASKAEFLHESASYSTVDHVKNLPDILKDYDVSSILVVTSYFHTRRSYHVFYSEFKNRYNVGVVGAEDGIDYSSWWKSHESIEMILIEWQKLIWYFLFL